MPKRTTTASDKFRWYTEQYQKEVAALLNDTEYCFECNSPLSSCGPENVDGTPSTDCQVCQLRSAIGELRKQALAVHAEIYSFYGDSVKYPQLQLPEYQQQQLERILVAARKLIKL